jgi:hypothetical protein
MDLRRRKARATDIFERIDHIGNQALDLDGARIVDRFGNAAEHRVSHAGDFQNGHVP